MLSAAVRTLHRALRPVLRPLRPIISPLVEALPQRRLAAAINIADLRECAQKRAHTMVFGYLDAGSDDGLALKRSREAFNSLELHYRVLVGSHPPLDLSTSIFGHASRQPFFAAPTAGNRMFHCEGEVATARVAEEYGVPYALSTFSTSTFEQIRAVHHGPKAFQLYVWRDRDFLKEMLSRARANGFETLVLTADMTWFGNREPDKRNGFTIPPSYSARQIADALRAPAWAWDFLTHRPYSYALVDAEVNP